ncbi:MAG: T9SS type A sorting domain-containing protein [Bacteroidota bacterium]
MQKFIIIYVMLVACNMASAQTISRSVIATTGSSNEQLSYTLGETVIETASSGTIILTQGFQQPEQVSGTYLDPDWGTLTYLLYPNPTQAELVLEISSSKAQRLRVSFCDVKGKIVMGAPDLFVTQQTETSYEVGHFAAGTYVLLLQNEGGGLVQSIRFVKTN